MINKNVNLLKQTCAGIVSYTIGFDDSEQLDFLFNKFGGVVNAKISRPVSPGTEEQNRAMHALMAAYFITGLHSSPAKNIAEFKLYLKYQYGPCFDFTYNGTQVSVPKSWAKYSKKERRDFIDALISEVTQSGAAVESEKIQEILMGMELKGGEK
jgi:hypothetical protein